jgi:uncharacterized protein YndB with AHSA1/START domain/biotin operon repressor
VDTVFKALADQTRRSLLDELFREDGQSLTALAQRLPMTRIGVMKHLKVLEEAGLVTTRRRGREKLHFLNPVPIRLVHDRWVSKYAEPWVAGLSDLKRTLEEPTMEKVFEIYIKTTPERLWEAITNDELRAKYNFGVGVQSDWTAGSTYEARHPAGVDIAAGENLEVDPPRKLVQTWRMLMDETMKAEGFTRLTYEIESIDGGVTKLTIVHELENAPMLAAMVAGEAESSGAGGGWAWVLSDLKTVLESGAPMAER